MPTARPQVKHDVPKINSCGQPQSDDETKTASGGESLPDAGADREPERACDGFHLDSQNQVQASGTEHWSKDQREFSATVAQALQHILYTSMWDEGRLPPKPPSKPRKVIVPTKRKRSGDEILDEALRVAEANSSRAKEEEAAAKRRKLIVDDPNDQVLFVSESARGRTYEPHLMKAHPKWTPRPSSAPPRDHPVMKARAQRKPTIAVKELHFVWPMPRGCLWLSL